MVNASCIGALVTIINTAHDYPFLKRAGFGGLDGPRARVRDVFMIIGYEQVTISDGGKRGRCWLLRTRDQHVGELWIDEVVAL